MAVAHILNGCIVICAVVVVVVVVVVVGRNIVTCTVRWRCWWSFSQSSGAYTECMHCHVIVLW